MKPSTSRRRHRLAPVGLLLVALVVTGASYSALRPSDAQAATSSSGQVETGSKLFTANCATCHGMSAQGTENGPSLIGVGGAAVDFQVGTGRMPLQAQGVQAPAKPPQFNDEQIAALAAYVASLEPGPQIPRADQVDAAKGDPARGMELFRTNCAMCHNAVGAGGALSEGKSAPSLENTTPKHIYEAMATGPESMPVFNEKNLSAEDKRDVIAYLNEQHQGSPGGLTLGSLGPVSEGLWVWIIGIGLLIGAAVWIGAKSS